MLDLSPIQILVAVVVILGFALLWASAAKGIERRGGFTDNDQDGAPDATAREKEATIAMFKEEQARRHPEDHKPGPDN